MAEAGIGSFARNIAARERKPLRISAGNLVTEEPLFPDNAIPWLIRPAVSGVNLNEWAKANRQLIETRLTQHGALLFRDFAVSGSDSFESFAEATSTGGLIDYTFCSTPRRRVKGSVYTSTEYPADRSIPMHNEMSYTRTWPMKIWFHCVDAPAEGGATPIADSGRVCQLIGARIREQFAIRGVMYVRNYRDNIDLSCRDVFGTAERAEIARYCEEAGIEFEFGQGNELKTRQRCQAVTHHPRTNQELWFNQAHLFHVSSLDASVAASLIAEFGESGLPRNAFYGDGAPIDERDLDEIRGVYTREMVRFPWRQGDILMLDNMRVAHGREPFEGPRKVIVAMAEPSGAVA
jgi:alpha-ketoglutarate-dependent taurine dioxygenase